MSDAKFDIPDPREPDVVTHPDGPGWVPTPEEQAKMNAFVAEFYRTRRPVAILCRIAPGEQDGDTLRVIPMRIVRGGDS